MNYAAVNVGALFLLVLTRLYFNRIFKEGNPNGAIFQGSEDDPLRAVLGGDRFGALVSNYVSCIWGCPGICVLVSCDVCFPH